MARKSAYRKLDAGRITAALELLCARISERFPGSGLAGVGADLLALSKVAERRVHRLAGPYLWLRLLVMIVIAGFIAGVALTVGAVKGFTITPQNELLSLAQGLESVANLLILFGAAAWFLLSLEERLRRRRVLGALHELRSVAHVVDMHQLTKDPTAFGGPKTTSSPGREMTVYELTRYLDYCVELLALTAKLAALYAGETNDPVITAAVNDIETLTGSLSRSIWQKLIILSAEDGPGLPPKTAPQSAAPAGPKPAP